MKRKMPLAKKKEIQEKLFFLSSSLSPAFLCVSTQICFLFKDLNTMNERHELREKVLLKIEVLHLVVRWREKGYPSGDVRLIMRQHNMEKKKLSLASENYVCALLLSTSYGSKLNIYKTHCVCSPFTFI